MPLHLITGPANAAKAKLVLDAVHEVADQEPFLVVPTGADADRYRRELVERGGVFGVRVVVFGGLVGEVARRAGCSGSPVDRLTRERAASAAVRSLRLGVLSRAAETDGFPAAVARLSDELAGLGIDHSVFADALAEWAGDETGTAAYAAEVAALIGADEDTLATLGLRSRPRWERTVIGALEERPDTWGQTPVLLYGFDDLTRLELDLVRALAGPAGAGVTLALTYEHDRDVFAARVPLWRELYGLGASERALDREDRYYRPEARAALSHLERWLFVPDAPRATVATGVRAIEGGGERAELELAAVEIAAAIADGVPAEQIAVVQRGLDQRAGQIASVFGELGIAIALRRSMPVAQTALGAGLLALIACANGSGRARDVLSWLKTDGVAGRAEVDRFERMLRREGVTALAPALSRWERESGGPVPVLDEMRNALASGFADVAALLRNHSRRLLAASGGRTAPLLTGPAGGDAQAAIVIARELERLASRPPALHPDVRELPRVLADLTVDVGHGPGPGRVTVAEPQDLRARRVRRLYLLGLVDGVFPRPARPEPFLGDEDRKAIDALTGIGLRLTEDVADVERLYCYQAVSRPEDELVIGWHTSTEDGDPVVRSLFVDDIAAVMPDGWLKEARTRPLGGIGFPEGEAPNERSAAQRAAALAPSAGPPVIAPLTSEAVLTALAERPAWSPSAIETWIACPVKWFVDRHLGLDALDPDAEPLRRGTLAHAVLERIVPQLEAGGGIEVALPEARAALVAEVLGELSPSHRMSINPEQLQAGVKRLEADLIGYLGQAAAGNSKLRPAEFELSFGRENDELAAPEIAAGVRLRGTVDRVDLSADGRQAVIFDYKGRGEQKAPKSWIDDGRIQVLLYMLAVRALLGVDVAGGFYQPLNAAGHVARGVVRDDVDLGDWVKDNDRVDAAQLEDLLEQAAALAERAVAEIRSGALAPRPGTCAYGGGCAHPSICRAPAVLG
ncbi:MAG: PD-(D/E)XK nuclease family protein [Baekduia sp.]